MMSYRFKNNSTPKPQDSGSSSSIIITNTTDDHHHHPSTHDQLDHQNSKTNYISSDHQLQTSSVIRSRWSPKPEQILILESIFNNGMVNPSKDETIKIRMVLETFGPVVDANVFYWFQNRRSKSRRLHRQIQANTNAQNTLQCYSQSSNFNNAPFLIPLETQSEYSASYSGLNGGFSSIGTFDGFVSDDQLGVYVDSGSSVAAAADVTDSYMQYQQQGRAVDDEGAGRVMITVFINGVATEVPTGPVDINEMIIMCGGGDQDLVLLHSSGNLVPVNEYGFSYNSLQHGESYFLVHRST